MLCGEPSACHVVRRAFQRGHVVRQAFSLSCCASPQRKTDEESPVKDADAKQSKQEATVNGDGDSGANGNRVQETGGE